MLLAIRTSLRWKETRPQDAVALCRKIPRSRTLPARKARRPLSDVRDGADCMGRRRCGFRKTLDRNPSNLRCCR